MYSLLLITENIQQELQKRMDSLSFRWKGSDSTDEYEECKPIVYAYTYDDLTNDQPLHTPSILIQCMNLDDEGTASYIAHICICNPAKQDKETTTPVQGSNNVYEYGTSDDFDSSVTRSELYRACLMLGEQVYLGLKKLSNNDIPISNVVLDTPNPYLAEFPYCSCTVSFDVECQQTETKENTKLWNML